MYGGLKGGYPIPGIRKFLHVKSGCPEISFRSELLNPEPGNDINSNSPKLNNDLSNPLAFKPIDSIATKINPLSLTAQEVLKSLMSTNY